MEIENIRPNVKLRPIRYARLDRIKRFVMLINGAVYKHYTHDHNNPVARLDFKSLRSLLCSGCPSSKGSSQK